MWIYDKKLQYPVNIKNTNPKLAKVIISQLGGPDGELAASLRYLNQRYTMPSDKVKGLLTDIGVSVSKLHILKQRIYGDLDSTTLYTISNYFPHLTAVPYSLFPQLLQ